MNKLLIECQRLASRLDGTYTKIGYYDKYPMPLGTGSVSVYFHARLGSWVAVATWGYGDELATPATDYPKDALKCLKRYLKSHLKENKHVRERHNAKKNGKRPRFPR